MIDFTFIYDEVKDYYSKQNHGYRYAMVRGLQRNQHYTWLICAAQNMKNIALKTTKYQETIKNEGDTTNIPSFLS